VNRASTLLLDDRTTEAGRKGRRELSEQSGPQGERGRRGKNKREKLDANNTSPPRETCKVRGGKKKERGKGKGNFGIPSWEKKGKRSKKQFSPPSLKRKRGKGKGKHDHGPSSLPQQKKRKGEKNREEKRKKTFRCDSTLILVHTLSFAK